MIQEFIVSYYTYNDNIGEQIKNSKLTSTVYKGKIHIYIVDISLNNYKKCKTTIEKKW